MDWFAALDGYCERIGPDPWAEPVNALSNLAFLIAAFWVWQIAARPRAGLGRLLCLILAVIGIGSGLFHTYATLWSSVADVAPILLFVAVYIFAANRDFIGLGTPVALAGVIPALGLAVLIGAGLGALMPFLGASAGYLGVATLILIYGLGLYPSTPRLATGLFRCAGLLFVSIAFRTLDEPLCAALPIGTHFLWHLLNAAVLAQMIALWSRHALEVRGARG